jgi:hypothetical protein
MKLYIKTTLFIVLGSAAFSTASYFFWYKPKFKAGKRTYFPVAEKNAKLLDKLHAKGDSLRLFAQKKKYNEEICFLVDMSIPSGRNRFFVYNMKKDSLLLEGLVAHGSCDNGFQSKPFFSNKINSGCSCIGRFKIGNSYTGNFGPAYKLHGLDTSNNNAFDRFIVLHAYECVPEEETDPIPICNSRGCPMVSPGFLERLKPIIKESSKPLLLWIYE